MGEIAQDSEQYLSQIATDFRTRMSEIKELREAIQSAEAIKASHKSASPDIFRIALRFVNASTGRRPATQNFRIGRK